MPKYTEGELRKAVKVSNNYAEVLRKLGLRTAGGNSKLLKKWIKEWGIDVSHFLDPSELAKKYWKKNLKKREIPLENILVVDNNYHRSHLKKRLYREGLKKPICELCGQNEIWQGKKMSLILDHINGVWNDNRLDNLRIVCPNCNATLPTHCGKNLAEKKYCLDCEAPIKRSSTRCQKCNNKQTNKSREKIDWPSTEKLLEMVKETNYLETGRRLGVSDNAVRKRIRNHPE